MQGLGPQGGAGLFSTQAHRSRCPELSLAGENAAGERWGAVPFETPSKANDNLLKLVVALTIVALVPKSYRLVRCGD